MKKDADEMSVTTAQTDDDVPKINMEELLDDFEDLDVNDNE
jgi:nonsense-mediated mRNA decay protein 3